MESVATDDWRLRSAGSIRLLQLQLDVHEVVWRPRTRILEREYVLVPSTRLFDTFVERLFLFPIDEKCGVGDHAIADRFVRPAGDGDRLERLVNLSDVTRAHL